MPVADAHIRAHLRERISEHPALADVRIETIVDGGYVIVKGVVRREAERVAVEEAAAAIRGIRGLDNQLCLDARLAGDRFRN